MSTLVIVLAEAMAVPEIGPEKVSGEMEQRLDLSGEWEGTWWVKGEAESVAVRQGSLILHHKITLTDYNLGSIIDEGDGKLQVDIVAGTPYLGIYRQQDNCLTIAIRSARTGRPASFRDGDGQELLILHRVKPQK